MCCRPISFAPQANLSDSTNESSKMKGKFVDPEEHFGPGSKGDEFVKFKVFELDPPDFSEMMRSELVGDASAQPQESPDLQSGLNAQIPDTTNEGSPPLCEEQQHVVDAIVKGQNVFYTGTAGCGKSSVLHALVPRPPGDGEDRPHRLSYQSRSSACRRNHLLVRIPDRF
jgi:hypothetical protein